MRHPVLLVLASGALCGLLAAGCQTYDFEPVSPVTLAQTTQRQLAFSRKLKPNLFILVDRSGSMSSKINPSCTSNCATRIGDLKGSLASFLTTSGKLARLGVTFFPDKDIGQCAPAGAAPTLDPAVPLPPATLDDTGTDAALQAQADLVKAAINAVAVEGGTPTAASVAFVGTLPGLNANDQRDDYVLLMTDGLPNCNSSNANNVCACGSSSCAAEAQCKCTLGVLPGGQSACLSSSCNIGCLDQDQTVARIRELALKKIKTIVVGFGADTSGGDAKAVLNAMAQAGQFPRACPDGSDTACGAVGSGNTCDPATKLCSTAFYQASNGAELTAVLTAIGAIVGTGNPCQFILATQPTDASYLAVIIDGVGVEPGPTTWGYSGGAVTFVDASAVCQKIKASTAATPVDVEIRIVQRL